MLDYGDGPEVHISGGWHHPKSYPFSMEFAISCEGGTLDFHSGLRRLTLYRANGESEEVKLGETDGFVKLIADAQFGEILGVHIIGPEATEMIAEVTALKTLEATLEEIWLTMHAHPTLAEALLEAALAAEGRAIHL